MLMLIKILIVVYFLAINLFSFLLMRTQKLELVKTNQTTVKDSKLFLVGVMGGALGIFISTFILAYRRDSMFIMIVMPLLITITVYFIVAGIFSNFSLFLS